MIQRFPPNVVALRERTPAQVVLDIEDADRRWRNHWADELESELLDRCDELKAELRRMVEDAMGVPAQALAEALS